MTPRRVNPPHYFLLALVAMALLWRVPGSALVPAPWPWVGALFVAAGAGISLWAAQLFQRAGTNIIPLTQSSALVTTGPFAHTRNPMYVGMLLTLAGVAIALNRPWPWLVWPAFLAVIYFHFVRHEERLMEATFGDAYRDYRGRVRRFV